MAMCSGCFHEDVMLKYLWVKNKLKINTENKLPISIPIKFDLGGKTKRHEETFLKRAPAISDFNTLLCINIDGT